MNSQEKGQAPSTLSVEGLTRIEATLDRAYGAMAQAFQRIHGLPRTSDTAIADALCAARAQIETCKVREVADLRAALQALAPEESPLVRAVPITTNIPSLQGMAIQKGGSAPSPPFDEQALREEGGSE